MRSLITLARAARLIPAGIGKTDQAVPQGPIKELGSGSGIPCAETFRLARTLLLTVINGQRGSDLDLPETNSNAAHRKGPFSHAEVTIEQEEERY
ncbi:hypothetical protein T265_10054 [Opisthorchis viverrini]|uniref:Uncharacterized protein n=1 Tax=Opisthorchis viverrini TaxID=6198 RepID=A0A075A2U3_OPIVI|nr:hypothetical protein T265_10054 [Opisthorchis viverrini]KER21684.1 hypothetical protein T265_10054 [Opisthorchis viverrini]